MPALQNSGARSLSPSEVNVVIPIDPSTARLLAWVLAVPVVVLLVCSCALVIRRTSLAAVLSLLGAGFTLLTGALVLSLPGITPGSTLLVWAGMVGHILLTTGFWLYCAVHGWLPGRSDAFEDAMREAAQRRPPADDVEARRFGHLHLA